MIAKTSSRCESKTSRTRKWIYESRINNKEIKSSSSYESKASRRRKWILKSWADMRILNHISIVKVDWK